jgi:sugar/nucleoside kinase (ribokinase family)
MFNKNYDIITFGSAAQDIYIKSKDFVVLGNKDFVSGQGICLPFGSKIEIEDIIFSYGGGGINTASTFAKQGFRTAFCGAIGVDSSGLEIVRDLKQSRIDTRFLVKKRERKTNHSIVISGENQDRTILVYRGASDLLSGKDIDWQKISKTKWFYLAPFAGLLCQSDENNITGFEKIVNFAFENKIKIAVNPSKKQLSLPMEELKRIFSKVDVLFLNQEEASYLTKISFEKEFDIFKKIDEICPGVAVMTKGEEGVVVSDGKHLYSAKPNPDREIVDTTGAGDSFASGFISDFIKSKGNIESAIQFGLANSEANLSEIGAKIGILNKNSKFVKVEVNKQLCSENNLCIEK